MIARARTQIAAWPQTGPAAELDHRRSRQRQERDLAHARAQNSDLIVLGCRERHGLSILVNRTEDTVLHGAPCDVLAVRVR